MQNILTIARRDLRAYFTSPIGYILMMVFVSLSVGLYITSFFTFPIADMRPYFSNLPLFLCVFIPAVTMRVWAEERKENTWEMLLTFPMKGSELVLGKFIAASVFFMITLAATITVPWMLLSLGNPDLGAIFGGYLGTVLLGCFFLSLGIFFSGFFKDQIVAFAVTLLTAFSFFLVGTPFIAQFLDDKFSPLGSYLSSLLGFFGHYEAFTRGVVDLADVVYFVAWTVIFLVLNIMFIEGRNRPGARSIFAAALVMSLGIGLAFNYLMTGSSILRFDLTEDKIYTVSDATVEILENLDHPVTVKYYVTPQSSMPTQVKDLEQQVTDKLEEMRVASDGKVDYSVVYLDVANVIAEPPKPGEEDEPKDEDKLIEERMIEKGVQPFNVQTIGNDEVTSKLIYSSLGIAYSDAAEEIIPQIVPNSLQELEYRLVSTAYKLSRDKKPIVALVAPQEAMNIDPQMRQMLMQMGQPIPESDDPYVYLEQVLDIEKYDVRRVELTKESPLPEEYDTLVVVNPRNFNERQRWEINRALQSGKSVVLAVQTYEWEYRSTPNGLNVQQRKENPGVNELLASYGLGVDDAILMDENKVAMRIQSEQRTLADMFGGGQTITLPTHIIVNPDSMDSETSITGRLGPVFYLWGTALDIDESKVKELGLDHRVIMRSSAQSWEVPATDQLTPAMLEGPTAGATRQAYPLMATIKGQFPDAFADQERPAWPEAPQQPGMPPTPPGPDDEPAATPVEAAPGQLLLLGCSEPFRKELLQQANLDLFLNSVDAVTLDENLARVRGTKPIDRTIDRPTDSQKTFWRMINYGLANVLIATVGIVWMLNRRRARDAYTMSHQRS